MIDEKTIALYKANLAFLLADVANSFLMESQTALAKHHMTLKKDQKQRWSAMMQQIRRAKAATRVAAQDTYDCQIADTACDESDMMHDLIWAVVDRAYGPEDLDRITHKILKSFTSKRQLL